jgi:hypothetical protein
MLSKLTSATVMTLAFGASMIIAGAKADEFKGFQGKWLAKPGAKTVQIEIKPNGTFNWVATQGNARAEGGGQLKKEGDKFFITLEFLQKAPLRITIKKPGAVLEMTDQNGKTVELTINGA